MKGSRGSANLVIKCQLCSRDNSMGKSPFIFNASWKRVFCKFMYLHVNSISFQTFLYRHLKLL